jgi:hypothetical protein
MMEPSTPKPVHMAWLSSTRDATQCFSVVEKLSQSGHAGRPEPDVTIIFMKVRFENRIISVLHCNTSAHGGQHSLFWYMNVCVLNLVHTLPRTEKS